MTDFDVEMDLFSLKQLCDDLTNETNAQNVLRLSELICQHATMDNHRCHLEHVLWPIYVQLQNGNLSNELRQQLVQLLRIVLSKIRITTANCFFKLYTALLVQVYDGHQANLLIVAHDELKDATIKCLNDLIKRTCLDVIKTLYVRENAPKFSQGVYTCLSIAKTEKSIPLRVTAIETLMVLAHVHDEGDHNDIELRTQMADMFMLFLPGIAGGLCQIAVGNQSQNHCVTMVSIKAYSRIVSLVMGDDVAADLITDSVHNIPNFDESPNSLRTRQNLRGDKGMKRYIKTARRSREWLDTSSTKLNASMQSLMHLVKHSHFQVRKELVLAVKLILAKCLRNMKQNLTVLVEILILLSEDKTELVKDCARVTLNSINTRLMRDNNMKPLVEIFEENFYTILTKLPRLIRRSDDATQQLFLDQLIGYLRLLSKERLPYIMVSSSHLRRLVLALVYVAELDCSRISVLEGVQVEDIDDSLDGNLCPTKCYKFITETYTEDKLMGLCKLLAELGDIALLVDCIFDLTSDMPRYRKELALILNWITSVRDPAIPVPYKRIHDYYTHPENWYLPIQVREEVTLGDAQSNIVYCCILTEGLGIIAANLRNEYEEYLLKTLYLVIERAGSGNNSLSRAGLKTLGTIAQSQNYPNVADFLRDNVDYISYHMTMKMRRVERNPGVLSVFSVIMKYSTMELLPCPKDAVEVVLAQLSANPSQKNAYSLMEMLYIFVMCIKKKAAGTDDVSDNDLRGSNGTSNSVGIVIRSVLDHYQAKKDSDHLDDGTVASPADIERELKDGTASAFSAYNNPQDEEVKLPPYMEITERVIKCCFNVLPTKDLQKSLLAMTIIEEGIHILSKSSELLLPIVHQLWHPLVDRFNHSNILVMNRAWQLLYALAHAAQDFIRTRTLKEVLPALSRFLIKSANESYKKGLENAYEFTQTFKLQKLILKQIASLTRNLKLHERQLWQVLEIVQPYLSAHQHYLLQECCVQSFKDIAAFQADIVWVKCLSVWNDRVAPVPVNSNFTLAHLKETSTCIAGSEYRTNIESILALVEELTVSDV